MKNKIIRIATRNSPMAVWQANAFKQQLLQRHPAFRVEIIGMSTKGDEDTTRPLQEIGGKSLFVKELQVALLAGNADIAVHCVKDMSVLPVRGLSIGCYLERDDPRDALVSTRQIKLESLPSGAVIGTSSPRRASLVKKVRPDLRIKPIRGNVNTRLNKLANGDYDAILLSYAGLKRLNLLDHVVEIIPTSNFIPAIGQGALAVEYPTKNEFIQHLLEDFNHKPTQWCVEIERTVNRHLLGDCHSPIGAHCEIDNSLLHLNAFVADPGGRTFLSESLSLPLTARDSIGEKMANQLKDRGALKLLANNRLNKGDQP